MGREASIDVCLSVGTEFMLTRSGTSLTETNTISGRTTSSP